MNAASLPLRTALLLALLLPVAPFLAQEARALDARALYKQVQGSVVRVICDQGSSVSEGTGFFVGDGTLVATNHHVVDGARTIDMETNDGDTQRSLRLVYADRREDLALIRVQRPGTPLPLAETRPEIGQEVMTIGHPLGLENSISLGVVSGLRTKEGVSLVQTTAAISQGNSGGPLLDEQGRVLGINTFYYDGGQNLNFAVAAEHLIRMLSRDLNRPDPQQAPRGLSGGMGSSGGGGKDMTNRKGGNGPRPGSEPEQRPDSGQGRGAPSDQGSIRRN